MRPKVLGKENLRKKSEAELQELLANLIVVFPELSGFYNYLREGVEEKGDVVEMVKGDDEVYRPLI